MGFSVAFPQNNMQKKFCKNSELKLAKIQNYVKNFTEILGHFFVYESRKAITKMIYSIDFNFKPKMLQTLDSCGFMGLGL